MRTMLSVFLMAHSNMRLALPGRRADIPLMRWLVPAGAVFCLLPIASPAAGLVAGAAIGLTAGNPYLAPTRRWTHRLLALSVIGLGAGMDLRVVAATGARGVRLHRRRHHRLLVDRRCCSRARCGSRRRWACSSRSARRSAAAAPSPRSRRRCAPAEHAVSVALATVFLLNGVALFVFPLVGHGLALDQQQFGAVERAGHPRHQLGRRRRHGVRTGGAGGRHDGEAGARAVDRPRHAGRGRGARARPGRARRRCERDAASVVHRRLPRRRRRWRPGSPRCARSAIT